MILKKLLESLDYELVSGNLNVDVEKVVCDSNAVIQKSAFIAIPGYKVDGHNYISTAISKGAKVIILEQEPKKIFNEITYIKIPNTRMGLSQIANNFYKNPSSKLKVIGITGTNGKTSTSMMAQNILECSGKKVGIIGTIGSFIDDEKRELKNTTPESIELQEILSVMVEKNMEYAIMEVSSHALQLNRVTGIEFSHGVFTNLTQDHLDFHVTMEKYFQQKQKLFYMTSGYNIINIDDSYGRILSRTLQANNKKVVTYGLGKSADLHAVDMVYSMDGVDFTLRFRDLRQRIHCPIPGNFTLYNVLAAIAIAICEEVPLKTIAKALKNMPTVPGRIERIRVDTPYQVIIDFAHSPDGLQNIICSLKETVEGRLITLFGCGGDRDKTKRPIMGKIAGDLSDYCIVTSDNPRSEDPDKIIEDILDGVKETQCPYIAITDRREAIKFALTMAKEKDIILLAGKGHETYQILKDRVIEFNEKNIVKELLEE